MLQKYFPVLGEVNSPLASLIALGFTATSAEVAINGISNATLETLLWESVEETPTRRKEIETSISELAAARVAAKRELKAASYRAACAARKARAVSKLSRRVKAVRKPISDKASLKALKGFSIEICRTNAAVSQAAVRTAVSSYNTATQAVETAIEGGDTRAIRSSVAALKVAVRLLEVRHLEFKFAREMLAISLDRHSA